MGEHLFHLDFAAAWAEETGPSTFQNGVGWLVRSPEAHVADDDPSEVQLLGEWGVMWTVYLASYFVYSQNASTEQQEYVCIWNQGWDLVCDPSQVSVVSSSIGGWDLRTVVWDLVAFEECGKRETDLLIG